MTIDEIKLRASKEKIDIDTEIMRIKEVIKNNPSGCDIKIPREKVEAVVLYCDNNNIPVYNIAENTLSVASTYLKLLTRESYR